MSLLPDTEIRRLAQEKQMITPFSDHQSQQGMISYGLSSYGYDARVGNEFKIFTNVDTSVVDPKDFSEKNFVTRTGDIVIPPNSFVLCHTVEYFKIPEDVLVICLGKSTYARCGLVVNVTPLEPGWEGQVTIEISNTTPLPAKIYANEGICQFLFFKNAPCATPYNRRHGKYMGQKGVTLPRIVKDTFARIAEHTMIYDAPECSKDHESHSPKGRIWMTREDMNRMGYKNVDVDKEVGLGSIIWDTAKDLATDKIKDAVRKTLVKSLKK